MLTEAELMPFFEAAERFADPGKPGAVNHKPRELYPLEMELIRCMVRGEWATPVVTDPQKKDKRPEAGDEGDHNRVRAKVIRWVCTDAKFRPHIAPIGLSLQYAMIEDEIDLEMVAFDFPIFLISCRIDREMRMPWLQAKLIAFSGSNVKSIVLDGAKIESSLFMRADRANRFQSEGEVRFLGATIGGTLDCSGALFSNLNGYCLSVGRTTVGDATFFASFGSFPFSANGEVHAVGAIFRGGIRIMGAELAFAPGVPDPEQMARPQAALNLRGARIVDLLVIQETPEHMSGKSKHACTIAGGIVLKDAVIEGSVRLRGVTLKPQKLVGDSAPAPAEPTEMVDEAKTPTPKLGLDLSNATITGELAMEDVVVEDVDVWLKHAKIDHFNDTCKDGTLGIQGIKPGRLRLDGLVYRKIAELKSLSASASHPWWIARVWERLRIALGRSVEGQARTRWLRLQRPPGENRSGLGRLIRWCGRPQSNFRPQPYEQLSNALFVAGRDAPAKAIQLNKFSDRAATRGAIPRLWCVFLRLTIGHGYRVHYVLLPLLVLLLAGGLLFTTWTPVMRMADGDVLVEVTKHLRERAFALTQDEETAALISSSAGTPRCTATRAVVPGYVEFNPWAYSLDALTPIIDLGQVNAWRPVQGWPLWYFWGHRIAGAVVFGLLLTGIGQTIVRRNPAAESQ